MINQFNHLNAENQEHSLAQVRAGEYMPEVERETEQPMDVEVVPVYFSEASFDIPVLIRS